MCNYVRNILSTEQRRPDFAYGTDAQNDDAQLPTHTLASQVRVFSKIIHLFY
jgi:hypothetical protein